MADALLLTTILDQRSGQYGHFIFEACFEGAISGYNNLFAKLTAVKEGDDKPVQSPLNFGSYVFAARRFEIADIHAIMRQESPTFTVDTYSFVVEKAQLRRTYPRRISSNNIWSDWPVDLVDGHSGSGGSNYVAPEVLVSHNAPRVFHDVFDGIKQYMGDDISNNSGWLRALLFVLPDYRLRIREIAGDQNLVSVKLMTNMPLDDIRAHCLVEGTGGRQEILEPISSPELTLELKSPVDQLESFQLFILGPQDGILDSYEQNRLHHDGRTRWLAGSQQLDSEKNKADLLMEIRKGEGTTIEFKPYVRMAEGEAKRTELIETAIAFANTGGGMILLGVNNNGEIGGIERELFRLKKTQDLLRAGTEYAQEIRTMMNDVTSRRLDLDMQPVQLAGHILLRIDVKELDSKDKPAWKLDTKDSWIRRGATNFKLDPQIIRDEFAAKPDSGGILGLGQPGYDY